MTLEDLLARRRSVRHYADEHLDPEKVAACLKLAQLAPSSSNMQLYEFVHVTDEAAKAALAHACLDQRAASTADHLVVFVTRQDLYRQRAHEVYEFEKGNVARNSPADRVGPRAKRRGQYYGILMPVVYARCFGLAGVARKTLATAISLVRPMQTTVSEGDIRTVVHKSCGLAAQTFMLAMAELDYDTCPLEGFDERRVKHLLGLPRTAEVTMVVACGKGTPRGIWGERFRVPFESVYRRL